MKTTKEKEKESLTKLRQAKVYETNPFLDAINGEVKIKHKTQMLRSIDRDTSIMLVNNDNEIMGHTAFMRHVQVDEDKFAKLYINQLGVFWDLQKTSMRVLTYILYTLKPNDDRVYFDMKECLDFCNYKEPKSVFIGLSGLITSNVIARSPKTYLYYINPAIIFNGNRFTLITTYEKNNTKESDYHQNSLPENTHFLEQESDGV